MQLFDSPPPSRRRSRQDSVSSSAPLTPSKRIRLAEPTGLSTTPNSSLFKHTNHAATSSGSQPANMSAGTTMSAKALGKRPMGSSADVTMTGYNDGVSSSSYNGGGNSYTPKSWKSAQALPNGARKLVIKNLRSMTTSSRAAGESGKPDYYQQTFLQTKAALEAILNGRQPELPLEMVYRGIEDLCRNGEAAKLAALVKESCASYLNELKKDVLAEGSGIGIGSVEMLRTIWRHWRVWSEKSITIRSIFSYMDRTYLLKLKTAAELNDMLIGAFRRMLFGSRGSGLSEFNELGERRYPGDPPSTAWSVVGSMLELVNDDRNGSVQFDGVLLRDTVSMMHICNRYKTLFEPAFLKKTVEYFDDFCKDKAVSLNLKQFITAVMTLIEREDLRCNIYNFDSTTKQQMLDSARSLLIIAPLDKLTNAESVGELLAAGDVPAMQALARLLHLAKQLPSLISPWKAYISKVGIEIVNEADKSDVMVVELLKLRRSMDLMARDAFDNNEDFTLSLRDVFANFINNGGGGGSASTKVGEMIAKYVDMLLRGGLKSLPDFLLADQKDRAAAEKNGQASTGDEDAELDRQLEQALELFRFIEGKDVFEAFYKKDLARRLIMGRSASQDAERNMIAKLKTECGANFTHNLEQMFKDQALAKEEMSEYKQWRSSSAQGSDKSGPELSVNILSAASWPTYPDVKMTILPAVATEIEKFDRYYRNKHTGRKLLWKHGMGQCVITARFNKGPKELIVSAQQATVLVLTDQNPDQSVWTYDDFLQGTGLPNEELSRTLQSLACGKARVLTKHPKGRDVATTDTFTVNKNFTDPKYRVKINQIQLKETKEENKETLERVSQDRQFETQAAIVRIMKSRKTMTHAQLVAEVISQTRRRGAVDTAEIKKNIEKLIEKDYLEREGGSYVYQA